MRELNKSQKRLLDEFFETIKDEHGLAVRDIVLDLMPNDVWVKLLGMGEFETIYNHTNNYLNSKA